MDKDEILKEINKTKKRLTNLEEMLEECEYGRWKPKDNENYWYIAIDGSVERQINTNHWFDKCHFQCLNYFRTYEQAEAEAEKILVRRQLEDIARRLNKGEEINWDDHERKHCIELYGNVIVTNFFFAHKAQGTVFCLDGNFKDVAIKEIGEERLKKYLRGE